MKVVEPPVVELVATLPASLGPAFAARFGVRTTLGVLTELLASAQHDVVMGAPFVQGEQGLFSGPLGMALRACIERDVTVNIVSTGASLSALSLTGLAQLSGGRLRMFQPRDNAADPRILGSHAKFCLTDGQRAYLGSANFTQKGISSHLELGVLLRGSAPRQLANMLREWLNSEYFVPVDVRS